MVANDVIKAEIMKAIDNSPSPAPKHGATTPGGVPVAAGAATPGAGAGAAHAG